MSIFGRIKNAIFGQAHAATPVTNAPQPAAPQTPEAAPSPSTAASAPNAAPAPANTAATSQANPTAAAPAPTSGAPASSTSTAATPSGQVDVEAIMNAAVAKSGQKLDWRHSIVDFMKALGMDASLQERKDLAAELDYTGDMHDSAKMNMFLHKALLKALAENGGKIPAELMD